MGVRREIAGRPETFKCSPKPLEVSLGRLHDMNMRQPVEPILANNLRCHHVLAAPLDTRLGERRRHSPFSIRTC